MAWFPETLTVGQRSLAGADRLSGLARRQAPGCVLLPRGHGPGIASSPGALAAVGCVLQDGSGVAVLASGRQRAPRLTWAVMVLR